MLHLNTFQKIIFILLGLLLSRCVEPIDIDQSLNFENAIVIEATITNELKHQEIQLSNSYRFDDDKPIAETNANVQIIDNAQNTYTFKEVSPGKYVSINEFSAQSDIEYQLFITTKNGKTYNSKKEKLPGITKIDDLYPIRETDAGGNDGVSILIDSYDPTGNSEYYRYEYIETYKIVAPYWSPKDLVVSPTYELYFVPKTKEEQICYNSVLSNDIIQTETNHLSEDRVSKYNIRRISIENPIITTRYSILVKQYIQTLEAYTYYKTVKKLSGSGDAFFQNQPGFIIGNVFSIDDPNETVIGFFELSSVSSKRLFFNYIDLFPNESAPPYFEDCTIFATGIGSPPPPKDEENDLAYIISSGQAKYYGVNLEPEEGEGPYNLVRRACGDCTVLGSNIKPDFWED